MKFAVPAGMQLLDELGAGSIFRVALLRDGERQLICKRLRTRMLDEPAGQRALQREAHVLGRTPHASVPQLLGQGSDARGPYLLQSRPDGAPLTQVVEGFVSRGRRMPSGLLRRIAERAFSLLGELHAQQQVAGLVHGDVGPDHLFVTPAGEVALIDFGQARWRDMPATLHGGERGTLPYATPEVARGKPPEQPDDVFALAASLAFAALGAPPCRARGAAAMLLEVSERGLMTDNLRQHVSDPLLGELLLGALAFRPDARLSCARTIAQRLLG